MIGAANRLFAAFRQRAGQGFGSLLIGVPSECAVCRSPVSGGSGANPLGLCGSCFRKIPWIADIVCDTCGRYEACPDCRRREHAAFVRNRSAVRYDDTMREWLALFKYRGDERLLELFARMLMVAYRKHGENAVKRSHSFDLITYVPLSEQRLAERGFNQAERLAVQLGKHAGIRVLPLLARTRHTPKQSFHKRAERLSNLEGAFAFDERATEELQRHFGMDSVRHIALVDDVYTTGTTLQHCSRLIKERLPEAKLYGLTWAR